MALRKAMPLRGRLVERRGCPASLAARRAYGRGIVSAPLAESESILRGAAAVRPEVREANYPSITSA